MSKDERKRELQLLVNRFMKEDPALKHNVAYTSLLQNMTT
jgi:hypothetical protein